MQRALPTRCPSIAESLLFRIWCCSGSSASDSSQYQACHHHLPLYSHPLPHMHQSQRGDRRRGRKLRKAGRGAAPPLPKHPSHRIFGLSHAAFMPTFRIRTNPVTLGRRGGIVHVSLLPSNRILFLSSSYPFLGRVSVCPVCTCVRTGRVTGWFVWVGRRSLKGGPIYRIRMVDISRVSRGIKHTIIAELDSKGSE